MTIVVLPFLSGSKKRFFEAKSVGELLTAVQAIIPDEDLRLVASFGDLRNDGSMDDMVAEGSCVVHAMLPLKGGKGGFGTLLKKQNARGKKTTNFDACRDLQGRRLRHSKAVERIKEWLEKKKEEDDLVAQLTDQGPKLNDITKEVKLDQTYIEQLEESGRGKKRLVECAFEKAEAEALEESSKKVRRITTTMDPLAMLSDGSDSSSDSERSANGAEK